MSHGQYLRDLLEPLGVYRWEGSFQWGELQSEGDALDGVAAELALVQREMNLKTAQTIGIENYRTLLKNRPETEDTEELRGALAALLRIGCNSYTLADINDTLRGCGVSAFAEETASPLQLKVKFAGCAGQPEGFDRIRTVIEEILPCHIYAVYEFRYMTWSELEQQFSSWVQAETAGTSWKNFEKQVILSQ